MTQDEFFDGNPIYAADGKTKKIGALINAYHELELFNGSALVAENGKVVLSKDAPHAAALRANDSFLVQGLDADVSNVAAAREHIPPAGARRPSCGWSRSRSSGSLSVRTRV